MKKINLLNNAFVIILCFFIGNNVHAQKRLKQGIWSGTLYLNDSALLPFNFTVKNINEKLSFELINAEDKIMVEEIFLKGDSLIVQMPVFDTEFRCLNKGDSLTGNWINHSRQDHNIIPFKASAPRDVVSSKPVLHNEKLNLLMGRWKCTFSPGTEEESFAVGLFKPNTALTKIAGTFLTESGDYRFLEGDVNEAATFRISSFDGARAFLFAGTFINSDSIVGHFYSGSHWHEKWIGQRDENFQLQNPDSLTFLKPGFTKVNFNFKNLEGKKVSLSDEKFKNKVIILQLMGSWCPNCMDETKFLAPFYEKYKSKGLEIVGLAFEKTTDYKKAAANVARTKKQFNVKYELLITEKTGKDQASEALPMLNKVMAFPTTIYIDKKGNVRKIYTGFYGPATGNHYTRFVEQTTLLVETLLAE